MEENPNTFEEGYRKFKGFVETYSLLPEDRNHVVVGFSGGKDASVLCDFLHAFKQEVRGDLRIELVNVGYPRFLYDSSDPVRMETVNRASEFWRERGFEVTCVDPGPDYPDHMLEGNNPCKLCATVIKPRLLASQIARPEYKGAVYCVGLNLDDIVGWFVELNLLLGGKADLSQIDKNNPKLYSQVMYLSTRLTCRLEVAMNNLLFSRPLMAFNDDEVRALVSTRGLPLVPEDCGQIMNREDFVDSPRREIAEALKRMRSKYPLDTEIGKQTLFASYQQAQDRFEASGLLPSLEQRATQASELLEDAARKV